MLGWFDDRVEARAALSKLTYLDQLSDLSRSKLPWGSALDEMETVIGECVHARACVCLCTCVRVRLVEAGAGKCAG